MLEGLDTVDWHELEPGRRDRPATDIPKVLRRMARADARTRQEVLDRTFADLQDLLLGADRASGTATAALPFLVDLAVTPNTVARPDLIDVIAGLAVGAAGAETGATPSDGDWDTAWRREWPRLRSLLVDEDRNVRRSALQLVSDRTDSLLERWHVEADRSVRLTVLLALGAAAAADDPTGTTAAAVRTVLDGARHGADRVMRVAAVIATARLDPQAPLRALPMLLELLTDPVLAPEFGKVWYTLDCEYPYHRDEVASWVMALLAHDTSAATSFVTGLAGAGSRTDDVELRRCAMDEAWRLLVLRPSSAPALLGSAAGLLADRDDDVRYKAVHLLAVLGPLAAPYADRLAALLDDPGESQIFDGTVGEHARWALTRIGDPRALPDLVERLVAPYRDTQGRGYCVSDPRRPDVVDVLRPLRAHAAGLVPAVREALRDEVARRGWLVRELREVLQAWGEDPTLPEETEPYPQPWEPGPMEAEKAATTVQAFAAETEQQPYWTFHAALASLLRLGHITQPVREALATLRSADRRLSQYGDYRAFLEDEEIRERIDTVLTLP